MRIGIQGWGSEGDLRPLIALAARLRRGGHEVRLVLSLIDEMDYGPLCQRLGVPLQVVPERMQYSLRAICQASRSADPTKVSRDLLDQAFFPHLEEMYAAAQALCAKSDVIIGLFSSWYVKAACLASGTPFVAVHYYPGLVPSREVPPTGFPSWRWLNRVSWALFGALIDLGFRAPAARFFASKGLPRVRHALPDVLLSDRLNLLATSPTLFPPAPDWGALHSVCGEFVLSDDDVPWQPSPSLRQFLESGEKPVLVSLGTMEHLAPERAKDLLLGAVRQARVRALIQTKSQGIEEGQDGEVYFLRWAPHRQLLPHCRAMVLHGGAGTTHAALRGGVPAVTVPFIFEQQLWGKLLHRAGSATAPLSFWKATPEKLAERIREAATSDAMRQRASALARASAAEDGTGTATRLLERLELR